MKASGQTPGAPRLTLALTLVLAVFLGGCDAAPEGSEGDPALPAVENPTGSAGYREVVDETLALLAEFWNAKLVDQGTEPAIPKRFVSYEHRSDSARCGGVPAVPQNAQYCALNSSIFWDANWLYGSLYRDVGPAAVSFLLAHEYGHFVQDKLKTQNRFELTIEAELNADCLAGAWFGKVDKDVARLTRKDFVAIYLGVLDVADPRGTPWQDPQAHGRAVERRQALGTGVRRGVEGCGKVYYPGFSRR